MRRVVNIMTLMIINATTPKMMPTIMGRLSGFGVDDDDGEVGVVEDTLPDVEGVDMTKLGFDCKVRKTERLVFISSAPAHAKLTHQLSRK